MLWSSYSVFTEWLHFSNTVHPNPQQPQQHHQQQQLQQPDQPPPPQQWLAHFNKIDPRNIICTPFQRLAKSAAKHFAKLSK